MTSEAFRYFPLLPGMKNPAIKDWQLVPVGRYNPVGNYGIALTADLLVLDFDSYKETGQKSLQRFFERYPNLRTRIVQTPRGGYHVYLRKPSHLKYRPKQKTLWPGVDFQSEGQFVCGPGTTTIQTEHSAAGTYVLLGEAPIADAPADLLAELEIATDRANTNGADVSLSMSDQFKLECQLADPAIEGEGGDDATYRLACRGYDMGLPADLVWAHMRDEWNPRCSPPWGEGELYEKVKHAFRYAKNAPGNKSPEAIFTPPAYDAPAGKDSSIFSLSSAPARVADSKVVSIADRREDQIIKELRPDLLQIDTKGNMIDSLANVACLLRMDPAWRGQFRYNQFASRLEFADRPPWRKEQLNAGLDVSKRDFACIQVWFSGRKMEIPENKIHSAVQAIAEPFHPVKDYVESITWDGVARLDKILIDTAGAEDTPLNRDIGRCLIGGAIRRIYEPGCQHDTIPIFEGDEGTRKSTWIQVLGGQWSSTGQLIRGDKDTYQNLRGRWIVELPEINSTFSRADANWLKGIITTRIDVYRPSYGHGAIEVPRESVFVGTINPDASDEYLKEGEQRRFLPVKTGRMNIELLTELRDQYFAEALHRYKAGEQFWMHDPRILAAARELRRQRQEKDPWKEVLAEWLANKTEGVTPGELYAALGLSGSNLASHVRKRVYGVMKQLRYEYQPAMGSSGKWVQRPLTIEDLL